jgi:hypothetical protein
MVGDEVIRLIRNRKDSHGSAKGLTVNPVNSLNCFRLSLILEIFTYPMASQ